MVSMERLSGAMIKDLRVLTEFVELYCRSKHGDARRTKIDTSFLAGGTVHLCGECSALVNHAAEKRQHCPLDPKPSCKKCPVHCYGNDYRRRIREVMAFSGRRMILRGRLDYLVHFLP
jgi:hypothetical protein